MSWSINLGSGSGDNFKTLDEIRAHVKSTTETATADDIFPEDIEIPSPKQSKTKRAPAPRKKPTPKTSKKKEEEPQPPPKEEEVKESDEEEEIVEESPKSPPESPHTTQNTSAAVDACNTMDSSDLKLVTEQIIKEMKALNAKVSAVSTILETIQAASVGRQYTMLTKNIEELRMLAMGGKEQVVRKKTRQTTKK
ncbi:m73R [Myxoma virus]|uniref:M73R n=1 Tax=Myxoma virus TaxID=10273 RepID=B2CWI0_9POXV|nr:m73R [Myxoma virus]ACB28868.1 m73R [recombinant virus 6918VP60-T2]